MFRTISKAVIITGMLAGCDWFKPKPEYSIDFDYSKPAGVGMFDPKSSEPGVFFVWNTAGDANSLSRMGELQLKADTVSNPRSLTKNEGTGFGVSGLTLGQLNLVEAEISKSFSAKLLDTVRHPYSHVETALSRYVREEKKRIRRVAEEDGEELSEREIELHIEDMFRANVAGSRIVVVTAVERPNSFTMRAGTPEGSDGQYVLSGISVPGLDIGSIRGGSVGTNACGIPDGGDPDSRPVCFIEVSVYDPYYDENRSNRIGWRRVDPDQYSQIELSEAFRSL